MQAKPRHQFLVVPVGAGRHWFDFSTVKLPVVVGVRSQNLMRIPVESRKLFCEPPPNCVSK